MNLQVEHWPIDRLIEYANNPRKNDDQVDRMCGAIREFGFRIPIVAKSDGMVVDGHLRLKAARKLGITSVPVALADELTDVQIKAFRLLANKSANWADWNDDLLRLELDDLQDLGFDLSLTGFGEFELGTIFADKNGGLTDPDEAPEPPLDPVTVLGDVWILGNHRLICGDSTIAEVVAKLCDGVLPDLANCDPPYGISVVKGSHVGGAKPFGKVGGGKPRPFAGRPGRVHGRARNAIIEPGIYAPIIGDDTTATAIAGYKTLVDLGVPAIVMWGGNYFANDLPPSRCWLVWDKENTGTFADAELAWTNQDKIVRLLRHQWSGLIKASERGERRVHPTQKPVALAEWVIETIAPEAKTVIDLFAGSASTLIACERKRIACFGAEMSSAYVDVGLSRWQSFTGQDATLEATGQTFDEVKAERTK